MTTTVDIVIMSSIVSSLLILAVPITFFFKLYWKILKLVKDNVVSKKERRVLIKGVLACLKGLSEHGCNGPVTAAVREIDDFILDQAHDIEEGGKERWK